MVIDYVGYKVFEINFSKGTIALTHNSGNATEDNNIRAVYIVS